ncbi:hypothetical protein A7D21_33925 [Pseudomonas sp. AP19]|nr:hypothetical protein A7D21_33925 [Pseudomonas sp. AP19]
MQIIMVVLLLVIAVTLAPGFFFGIAAIALSAGGIIGISLGAVVVILLAVYAWQRVSSSPSRQQAREERRIRKITDAANRRNSHD